MAVLTLEKENNAIRTLLKYVKKYKIADGYISNEQNKIDDAVLSDFDLCIQSAEHLLSHLDTVNTVLQQFALRGSARENTNILIDTQQDISDNDFKEICNVAEQLQLVCNQSADVDEKNYDIIIVPGALQIGVEKRLHTFCQYINLHPDFQGKVFIFGAQERPLYVYNHKKDEREPVVFELLAKRLSIAQNQQYTQEQVKKLCSEYFNQIQTIKSEVEIAHNISKYFEANYQIKWPTEFDMVECLLNKCNLSSAFINQHVRCIPTSKKTNVPGRATTADEAQFVAKVITEATSNKSKSPEVAVVTSFAYQMMTYIQYGPNISMTMLSPYRNMEDYIQNSISKRAKSVSDKPNTQLINKLTVEEIFDAFARFIFSQLSVC